MIKDTADAAMEAYEAWVRSNAPFTMTGLLSNDIFIAGYDEAMARECVWTPTRNFPSEYSTSCRQKRVDEDSAMRDYCPYCGGKIVPPDSGEERNDD